MATIRIPEVWRVGIPPLADRKFAFTRYSFNEIVTSTLDLANGKHAVRLVTRADADPRSKGRKLRVDRAVVYGPVTPQ